MNFLINIKIHKFIWAGEETTGVDLPTDLQHDGPVPLHQAAVYHEKADMIVVYSTVPGENLYIKVISISIACTSPGSISVYL